VAKYRPRRWQLSPGSGVMLVDLCHATADALADFYRRLLGWTTSLEEPGWVILRSPGAGHTLNFQTEERYARPAWPAGPGDQQMMMHLEIHVDDLEAGVAHALAQGATLASYQPQDDVRVCLDPAGHPFCLFPG
jgi:catechol 2,3-dioxygenase-like lactoylglutathione lyase family enzyme